MKSFTRLALAALPPLRPSASPMSLAIRSAFQPAVLPRQFSHNARRLAENDQEVDSVKSFIKSQVGDARSSGPPPIRRTTNETMRMATDDIVHAARKFKSTPQAQQFPSSGTSSNIGTLPPKMGPTAGRTVLVAEAGGIQAALTRLNFIMRKNKVWEDVRRQKFHERPGLKRKRLKSSRHRQRFAKAFRNMVGTILEMKGKGY